MAFALQHSVSWAVHCHIACTALLPSVCSCCSCRVTTGPSFDLCLCHATLEVLHTYVPTRVCSLYTSFTCGPFIKTSSNRLKPVLTQSHQPVTVISGFQCSYTAHCNHSHMIIALELQSLMCHCHWNSREPPQFQHFTHRSECSVQRVNGARNPDITVTSLNLYTREQLFDPDQVGFTG